MADTTTVNLQKTKKKFFTVQRIALIAIFAALMVVCSWISIPSPFSPGVAFSLQTFAFILAGLLLSPIESLIAAVVYIALGLIGLPVTTGFNTLYTALPTASGGYFIGFILAAWLVSVVSHALVKVADSHFAGVKKKTLHLIIYIAVSIIIGIIAVDVPGLIWGMSITKMPFGLPALTAFAFSFMPTDIIKCVLAAIVAEALETPLKHIVSR